MLSPGKGLPATLAAGDLAGGMEALVVTAPEGAEKDATASRAKVEGVEKATAKREVESPEGAGPDGKMVTTEGAAAIAMEASENPEAERVAEAFARAAERIAVSEVAKVLQSAIAEVETPAASGSRWGGGAVGACSLGYPRRHPVGWEAAAPAPRLTLAFQPCPLSASDG